VKNAVDPPNSSLSLTKTSTSVAPKATKQTVAVAIKDEVKFGGCLEMDAGLVANVGANANFFGLFNPSKTVPLFQKQFSLYKVRGIWLSEVDTLTDDGTRHASGTRRSDDQCRTSGRGTQSWWKKGCSATGRM
jgi:hypothetical protein